MKLFSPGALWFLLLVPVLIVLYILKQRFEEKNIPSLYLWQQIIADTEATSPFQKLKNNILFILQLLTLLLVIMALANPFIWWRDQNYTNIIVVIDNSGSMSGLGEKTIKLEEAKVRAEEYIMSLSSQSKITLITSGRSSRVELSGVSDKKEVIAKVRSLQKTNSQGNMEDSYSLVKAISSQLESYKVIYFTDYPFDIQELNGEVIQIPSAVDNVSLDYISHVIADEQLRVMLRVTNRGKRKTSTEVCLYGEKKLLSLSEVELLPNETKTVYFEEISDNYKYLYGELSEKDSNLEDNTIYSIVKQQDSGKILLASDKNVFLEKMLLTMKNVEIYKSSPGETIDEEFDLYIFDKSIPEKLPAKGSILFINPSSDILGINISEEKIGGEAEISSHVVTKYMENSSFVIGKTREITTPYWGNSLINLEGKTVAFAGELKGQRIGTIGFDLNNSDMPLTPEFPIFVNNLVSYLMDRSAITNYQYFCGDSIEIVPLPDTDKIYVANPTEERINVSFEYPVKPFEDTYLSGIYEIAQEQDQKESVQFIAVNFPTSESDIPEVLDSSASMKEVETSRGGINLKDLLLKLALVIILIEWFVYLRINGTRKIKKAKKGGELWG